MVFSLVKNPYINLSFLVAPRGIYILEIEEISGFQVSKPRLLNFKRRNSTKALRRSHPD